MWRLGVALASMFSVACSARLAAAPEREAGSEPSEHEAGTDAPAEVLSPTPCPADPNAECTSRFVRVDWFADDGGLDRCECVPPGEVQCTTHDQYVPDAAPPETPLGPSLCQCNVCGAARVQTFRCDYDPYDGNWTVVDCVE